MGHGRWELGTGMDVSGQETDWRSPTFRQKLVSQIENAMRKAGVAFLILKKIIKIKKIKILVKG